MTVPHSARVSTGFHNLFPPDVVAAELREPGDVSMLLPAEAVYVERAVPKRIREFAAGRACARRALAEFGWSNVPLPVAADRQPIWPDGMVGSISHTDGLCVAVVAERRRFEAIGLDCEVVGRVTEELWASICLPEEIAWLNTLAISKRTSAATFVFAVKEAFYKCQYPLTAEWLDFHDLLVSPLQWGRSNGSFSIEPVRPIRMLGRVSGPLLGRYRFHEEFVSAGYALEA